MLAAMNKKLEKLDSIEAHLQMVDTDIKELKHSLTFLHDTTSELQKQQEKQEEKVKKIEKEIFRMTEENTITRELVDIRAYSMRSNLIFYNIPETLHENPEQVVTSVLTKMEIPCANEIEIENQPTN